MEDYDTSIFGMDTGLFDDTDIGSPDGVDVDDDLGFVPSGNWNDETAEEEPEEPELYAGKFRTVEDLERSYSELQSLLGRKTDDMVPRLQAQIDELRAQLDDRPEEPQANWYDGLENDQILAALQADPGRVLDAIVEAKLQSDPRLTKAEQTAEQLVSAQETAQSEQMAAAWVVENNVPPEVRNEMVRIFNTDDTVRNLFEPALLSGNEKTVATAMASIARMALERVADTAEVRTGERRAAKRSAQTAPVSGTRGVQQSGNDYAKSVVNDILRSANSGKLPW